MGRGAARAGADRRDRRRPTARDDQQILGFLRNEIGSARRAHGDTARRGADLRRGDRHRSADGARVPESRRRPRAAGEPGRGRSKPGRRSSQAVPDRAYLAFDRLRARVHDARRAAPVRRALPSGSSRRIRRTGARGWRSRGTWQRRTASRRRSICCSTRFPTTRTAWSFIRRSGTRCRRSASTPRSSAAMSTLTREAVFYLDPHVCVRCRYRSTELLWQCPQCHEWNTFVEERHRAGEGHAPTAELRAYDVGAT